jgi:hypothetical protein
MAKDQTEIAVLEFDVLDDLERSIEGIESATILLSTVGVSKNDASYLFVGNGVDLWVTHYVRTTNPSVLSSMT